MGHKAEKIQRGWYEYRGYKIIRKFDGLDWEIYPPGENLQPCDIEDSKRRAMILIDRYEDAA